MRYSVSFLYNAIFIDYDDAFHGTINENSILFNSQRMQTLFELMPLPLD